MLGTDADGAHARSLVGSLVETFAVTELLQLAGAAQVRARGHHFRTHGSVEVGRILEDPARRVMGVEIKSSPRVKPDDFRGQRTLADHLGERFIANRSLGVPNQGAGCRQHQGVGRYRESEKLHGPDLPTLEAAERIRERFVEVSA